MLSLILAYGLVALITLIVLGLLLIPLILVWQRVFAIAG